MDPCHFSAKVTPEKWKEKVQSIYEEMCHHFMDTFPDYPLNPEIPLNDVKFVKSWDEVDYVTDSDHLAGLYYSPYTDRDINEIIVQWPAQTEYWYHTELWLDSVLAHEIFHYFTKSCCFEELKKVENLDASIIEASAYWAQNEYIKRHSNMILTDLISKKSSTEVKDMVNMESFSTVANILYMMAMHRYLHNAPKWFGNDPQKKFDNLIKGHYNFSDRFGY